MLNGYKLIGVCVTKVQDELCTGFLHALKEAAVEKDYRLIVFNSVMDYYLDRGYERGARSVYKLINYELIDVLVVVDHCFINKSVVNEIIDGAKAHRVPVVVMYGEYEGCFSVMKNYEDTYKQLISHVIEFHGARKLHFIAGTADEISSNFRLKCFREVMEQHGLDIPDYAIGYGEYWNYPVYRLIDKWKAIGAIPDAVICANDAMASAACDRLAAHGIKVPEDVIVTGFDGLESLFYRKPRLTTCAQDVALAAKICFDIVVDAHENNAAPYTASEPFSMCLSESCGCKQEADLSYRESADRLYRLLEATRAHESVLYDGADRTHESTDFSVIGRSLSKSILPCSAIGINSNLLSQARKNAKPDPDRPFTDRIIVLAARNTDYSLDRQNVYEVKEMYYGLDKIISDNAIFLLQSLYVNDEVCGYYMIKITDLEETAPKLHRLCRIINLDFGVILNRIRQEHMTSEMRAVQNRDTLTGLLNLKGLLADVDENYTEYSANNIVVSIYMLPRYKYIIENFGVGDADEAVMLTAEALQLANPVNSIISRMSEDEFVIINMVENADEIGDTINQATSMFFKIIEEFNQSRGKDYFVEVNCGCVVSNPGWENDIMSFIKAANGEMYLNRLKTGTTEAVKQEKSMEDYYRLFDLLIKKNLFTYHFQPIIDAHTGEIYAYEALMRTDEKIGMNPGQILAVAEEYKRMYDIERATLFNVMGYIDEHREAFEGKRVFINTIPGCFLNEEDHDLLVEKYGHLFGMCTIEITEQNDANDAELMQIKRFDSCQLAIDDYGTGFSNIVNLLRYQPQVIKIDRYLITNVHKDTNKRLFISSTIEFAKLNNILVLAEGVETKEELSKVIELGVDLIQGFYTARPSATVISEIPLETRNFIIDENIRLAKFSEEKRIYVAKDGDIVNMLGLAVEKYTSIVVEGGRVMIIGAIDHFMDMPIYTSSNSECEILLKNCYISSMGPGMVLGDNSSATLVIEGESHFDKEGIRVPPGTSLTLKGDSDLYIKCTRNIGAALGANLNDSFGKITIDMTGKLNIAAINENPICIGGGWSETDDAITILSGKLLLEAKGVNATAVGGAIGPTSVYIGENAHVKLDVAGDKAIALGGRKDDVKIVSKGELEIRIEGDRVTAIGSLLEGGGSVELSGITNVVMRSATALGIGAYKGSVDVTISGEYTNVYGEGNISCGIGNLEGKGSVTVTEGSTYVKLLSAFPRILGSEEDDVTISGGSQLLIGEIVSTLKSPLGDVVSAREIDADSFEAVISTPSGEYTYKAHKREGDERLCVYIPAECEIKQL